MCTSLKFSTASQNFQPDSYHVFVHFTKFASSLNSMSRRQLYPYTLQLLQNPVNNLQSYASEAKNILPEK